jgi:hypothetical protein
MRSRPNVKEQRAAILEGFPKVPQWFRKAFPYSKWGAELNARITPAFFTWLVGPMKVRFTCRCVMFSRVRKGGPMNAAHEVRNLKSLMHCSWLRQLIFWNSERGCQDFCLAFIGCMPRSMPFASNSSQSVSRSCEAVGFNQVAERLFHSSRFP